LAEEYSAAVREISQLLVEREIKVPGTYDRPVSYHDPCHMCRGHKVQKEPRLLLQAAAGDRFSELPEADWCCGGAGTYNISHPKLSDQVLARKMDNFAKTEADTLVTACPGCMLQLSKGLTERGKPGKVKHIVEILDEVTR
jgi:glycolate oxidase iron-sulfur subunit